MEADKDELSRALNSEAISSISCGIGVPTKILRVFLISPLSYPTQKPGPSNSSPQLLRCSTSWSAFGIGTSINIITSDRVLRHLTLEPIFIISILILFSHLRVGLATNMLNHNQSTARMLDARPSGFLIEQPELRTRSSTRHSYSAGLRFKLQPTLWLSIPRFFSALFTSYRKIQ